MVQSLLLRQFPELIHGFSERQDGNMSRREDRSTAQKQECQANRQQFFEQLGIESQEERSVIFNQQSHSSIIHYISHLPQRLANVNEVAIGTGDGLIADQPNLFLSVLSADCMPIFLYEPKKGLIASLHAGWRGLSQGIVPLVIRQLVDLGGESREVRVWLGPHIKVCHYDLKSELPASGLKRQAFSPWPEAISEQEGRMFLDLTKVAVRQLQEAGIEADNLEISPDCTACQTDRFFSYHISHGQPAGSMIGIIGRK